MDFLIRLRSEDGQIKDLAGNKWSINGSVSATANGIYFGGNSSSYLRLTDASKSLGSGDFTLAMWVNVDSYVSPYPAIFCGTSSNICIFQAGSNNLDIAMGVRFQETNTVSSALQVGKLIHLTVIRHNGTIKVYIDGVLRNTFNNFVGSSQNLSDMAIGIAYDSRHNSYFKGYLQDICLIKDKALWTSNFIPPKTFIPDIYNMYVSDMNVYSLINGTFKKVADNWETLATAEKVALFKESTGEPTIAQLETLGKFKVVSYADTSNLTLNMTAIPKEDQLVLPKKLIDLGSVEHIISTEILANQSGAGKVRIAITKGDDVWYKFDGLEFVPIEATAQSILADGNVASEINNITQTQWESFEAEEIGFCYALHIENVNDVANVDKLSMTVLAKGSWNKAVHGTDYTYGYPANDILRVNILADGDYKINYVK
jgi:hypothetical protein